jgi:hypothetical protein
MVLMPEMLRCKDEGFGSNDSLRLDADIFVFYIEVFVNLQYQTGIPGKAFFFHSVGF